MNKDDVINRFISDVEQDVTPSDDTLRAIVEVLKSKKKPGPKPYEEKGLSEIKKDFEMVVFFRQRKKEVSWDEAKEETSKKFFVGETTVERKERLIGPLIKALEKLYDFHIENTKNIQSQLNSFEPTNTKQEKLHYILRLIYKE